MRIFPPRLLLFLGLSAFSVFIGNPSSARADNWPQWRGPEGNGISRETNLPVTWNATSGIVWRCPLPEWGNSTPAIWGNAVFVTTQADEQKLLLLKINKQSGQIEWTREVGEEAVSHLPMQRRQGEQRRHQTFHETNNMASPSPVTDGQRVVVHFGNGELAAYDFDGNRLWRRNLQKDYGDYTIWWGHSNSPVLFENLVISVCMQDSCDDLSAEASPSYIVAHDLRTGKEVWKTMRMTGEKEEGDSYTTPLLWKNGGRQELVVMGAQVLDAYDPAAGKRLWYLPDLVGSRLIPGPVAADGMIYVTQGMRKPLLAVRPGGEGKRTAEDIVWQYAQATSDSPTPVVWGQSVFFVSNDGLARCLDAATGEVRWKEHLKGPSYRASPLAADGHVYFLNTKGLTTVLAATPELNRQSENQFDDETNASPIVSDGRIFIRGRKALYCIGK